MNQDSTNENVKRYYESQYISPNKLARLLEMHEQHLQCENADDRKKPSINAFFKKYSSIAASILVAFIIGAHMVTYLDTPETTLMDRITQEILLNHQKQFDVEFSSITIDELRADMHKLDFNLITSRVIDEEKFQIIGARYCSIQGNIAAQIKLQDNSGNTFTLYQTALSRKLKTLKDTTQLANGLVVKTWNEQGIFLGLAGASSKK